MTTFFIRKRSLCDYNVYISVYVIIFASFLLLSLRLHAVGRRTIARNFHTERRARMYVQLFSVRARKRITTAVVKLNVRVYSVIVRSFPPPISAVFTARR